MNLGFLWRDGTLPLTPLPHFCFPVLPLSNHGYLLPLWLWALLGFCLLSPMPLFPALAFVRPRVLFVLLNLGNQTTNWIRLHTNWVKITRNNDLISLSLSLFLSPPERKMRIEEPSTPTRAIPNEFCRKQSKRRQGRNRSLRYCCSPQKPIWLSLYLHSVLFLHQGSFLLPLSTMPNPYLASWSSQANNWQRNTRQMNQPPSPGAPGRPEMQLQCPDSPRPSSQGSASSPGIKWTALR